MKSVGRLLLVALLFSACHPAVTVEPPKIVNRGSYAYQKVGEVYYVAAANQLALKQALDEIGCSKGAQCVVEHTGEVFLVERHLQ